MYIFLFFDCIFIRAIIINFTIVSVQNNILSKPRGSMTLFELRHLTQDYKVICSNCFDGQPGALCYGIPNCGYEITSMGLYSNYGVNEELKSTAAVPPIYQPLLKNCTGLDQNTTLK